MGRYLSINLIAGMLAVGIPMILFGVIIKVIIDVLKENLEDAKTPHK